ncbi:hypothetical protein G7Y79_00005g016070 [Physcia stellaris]|nr:hypothetical protein G7Y79_00005g016070 [Physcia stellaris]
MVDWCDASLTDKELERTLSTLGERQQLSRPRGKEGFPIDVKEKRKQGDLNDGSTVSGKTATNKKSRQEPHEDWESQLSFIRLRNEEVTDTRSSPRTKRRVVASDSHPEAGLNINEKKPSKKGPDLQNNKSAFQNTFDDDLEVEVASDYSEDGTDFEDPADDPVEVYDEDPENLEYLDQPSIINIHQVRELNAELQDASKTSARTNDTKRSLEERALVNNESMEQTLKLVSEAHKKEIRMKDDEFKKLNERYEILEKITIEDASTMNDQLQSDESKGENLSNLHAKQVDDLTLLPTTWPRSLAPFVFMDIESISKHSSSRKHLNGNITQIAGTALDMRKVTANMNDQQVVSRFEDFNMHIKEHLTQINCYVKNRIQRMGQIPNANRVSLADLPSALNPIFLHHLDKDAVPQTEMIMEKYDWPHLRPSPPPGKVIHTPKKQDPLGPLTELTGVRGF